MKLLAVGLLLLGAAAPVRAAADTTPPKVESVAFSRDAITVSGLEVKLLTVTVHLTDETGVNEWDSVEQGHFPSIAVGRNRLALTLGHGTPQDGWYTGGIAITSDLSGEYRPTGLSATDLAGNDEYVEDLTTLGIDLPTVTVTSSNRPNVQLVLRPEPANTGDRITRSVRVTDAAGRPWPGVPVQIRYDNGCVEYLSSTPDGRTDASGVFSTSALPAGETYLGVQCAWIVSDFNVPEQYPTFLRVTTTAVTYRYRVSATPAATSAPAGSNVAVNGNLVPGEQGKELELQRLYAPGDWRTVNRGRTTPASRFTIAATPPGTATYSYRVLAPAEGNQAAATSPVFTIRGT